MEAIITFILLLGVLHIVGKVLGLKGSPAKKIAGFIFGIIGAVLRGLIQGAWEGIFGKPKKKSRRRSEHDDEDDE